MIAAVRDREPGDEVEVVVVRDGEEQRFSVVLAERPPDPTAEATEPPTVRRNRLTTIDSYGQNADHGRLAGSPASR